MPEFYEKQKATFKSSASAAGAHLPADRAAGVPAIIDAGERARDLERLVRADRTIKAVQRYVPKCATNMYAQLGLAAKELVDQNNTQGARDKLESLIQPFEGLERFPMPEGRFVAAANRLVGRAFPAAKATFSKEVVTGIEAASKGDPAPLRRALQAQWLFALLEYRAIAETDHFARAGVEDLVSFAVPQKAWDAFLTDLDEELRTRLATYARAGNQGEGWMHAIERWGVPYHAVIAAQKQTLDARSAGETDLGFLLRDLDQASVPSPDWPRWQDWAVGYHVVEAINSMLAGQRGPAGWHRSRVWDCGGYLRGVELAPPEANDG